MKKRKSKRKERKREKKKEKSYLFEGLFSVQPEALPGLRPTGTTRALLRGGLRDRRNQKRLDADAGVVHLLLREAGVDHVHDTVDGQRRLGDVFFDAQKKKNKERRKKNSEKKKSKE